MIYHKKISDHDLYRLIKSGAVIAGGNAKLKIYGTLHCASGKRMKKDNRVFFSSHQEALATGFRPCGHCMKPEYKKRKNDFIR